MEDGVLDGLIMSKEDFKDYFDERKIISKTEYLEYLKNKKNRLDT